MAVSFGFGARNGVVCLIKTAKPSMVEHGCAHTVETFTSMQAYRLLKDLRDAITQAGQQSLENKRAQLAELQAAQKRLSEEIAQVEADLAVEKLNG